MKPPIFIIGSPRSGTTLLRLMLTCHRDIVVPPECGFAIWWHHKYKDWPDGVTLAEFLDDLMSSRKIETWGIDEAELFRCLRYKLPATYAELVSAVYEYYGEARFRPFTRWGTKDNFHVEHISTLRQLFPDAAFVHIVRDGRDVACSYREINARNIDSPWVPDLPNGITDIALQWQSHVKTAEYSFDAFKWENAHEVKFEDLVLRTAPTLRGLCVQLGEEYDPAMLDYHVINREQGLEPRELLRWKEKTLLPPQASVVGRHKRDLSAEDRAAFEAIAGETLERYGY